MEAEFQLEKASYISHIDIGVYYTSLFSSIVSINWITSIVFALLALLYLQNKASFVAPFVVYTGFF